MKGDAVALGGDVRLEGDARVDGDAVSIGGQVGRASGTRVKCNSVGLALQLGGSALARKIWTRSEPRNPAR